MSVEKRLAVTIWKVATNVEFRTLSELFGLGRSTVGAIVTETCYVIATHLLPKYVKIPQGDALREIVHGFEHCWTMADLCLVCQKNATAVMRNANLSEAAKSQVTYNYANGVCKCMLCAG